MLKKLDFKSNFENTLQPCIFSVKFFNSGRGYESCRVLAFRARKSEQGLASFSDLGAMCKALVQSVLLLADTGEMIPSFIIFSQAIFPFSFLSLLAIIGLLLARQGS